MIEIKFTGTVEECCRDARKMLAWLNSASAAEAMERDARSLEQSVIFFPAKETAVKPPETPAEPPKTGAEATAKETASTATAATEEPKNPVSEPMPTEDEPPLPEGEKITLLQARARMNDLRQKLGAKAVRAVLDELGFAKFTDVPEGKYPELMVLCDAAEAGYAAQ